MAKKGNKNNGLSEELYFYNRIERDARRDRIYGNENQAIAHEAWLIADDRGYYDPRMLREAARNLGLWRDAATNKLSERLCEALPAPNPDPERLCELAERARAVRAAILQLSGRLKLLIFKRYFEEKKLEEISHEMGMSLKVCYAGLREAEATLRLALSDFEPAKRRKHATDEDLPLFREAAA